VERSKAEWRNWADQIEPTNADESAAVSTVIAEVLKRDGLRVVLTFLSMPGEVDLSGLNDNPELVLATTRTPPRGPLTMHLLEGDLERHPFGYLQPSASAPVLDPSAVEVVLVPGLLFTRQGGRLGHGRGYYDRLLSSFAVRPLTIGTTVERRIVDSLPMTETDVWIDSIATEAGYWEAGG
jgi:5-formyltetrahydrofolate cyclo-ligase